MQILQASMEVSFAWWEKVHRVEDSYKDTMLGARFRRSKAYCDHVKVDALLFEFESCSVPRA